MQKRRRLLITLLAGLALALAVVAAGCGGDDDGGGTEGSEDVSGSITLMGIWAGDGAGGDRGRFSTASARRIRTSRSQYLPAGDELVTRLATALEGGNPPDLATVAQPGTIADFAESGDIQPLEFARETATENLGESSSRRGRSTTRSTASTSRRINKSTVCYNVAAVRGGRRRAAGDVGRLPGCRPDAERTPASRPTRSPARTAGPSPTCSRTSTSAPRASEKYDQLAAHEIPWTDQSVKDALTRMAEIYGDTDNIAGGTQGSLQTDNPGSISKVLTDEPEAAMVIEGDFVPASVETTLEPIDGLQRLHLPGDRRLRVGGDRRRRLRRRCSRTARPRRRSSTT